MTKVVLNDSYQREGENEPPRRDEQRTNHEKNADGRPSEDEFKTIKDGKGMRLLGLGLLLGLLLGFGRPSPS